MIKQTRGICGPDWFGPRPPSLCISMGNHNTTNVKELGKLRRARGDLILYFMQASVHNKQLCLQTMCWTIHIKKIRIAHSKMLIKKLQNSFKTFFFMEPFILHVNQDCWTPFSSKMASGQRYWLRFWPIFLEWENWYVALLIFHTFCTVEIIDHDIPQWNSKLKTNIVACIYLNEVITSGYLICNIGRLTILSCEWRARQLLIWYLIYVVKP